MVWGERIVTWCGGEGRDMVWTRGSGHGVGERVMTWCGGEGRDMVWGREGRDVVWGVGERGS